jgi:hypothetical protein
MLLLRVTMKDEPTTLGVGNLSLRLVAGLKGLVFGSEYGRFLVF